MLPWKKREREREDSIRLKKEKKKLKLARSFYEISLFLKNFSITLQGRPISPLKQANNIIVT